MVCKWANRLFLNQYPLLLLRQLPRQILNQMINSKLKKKPSVFAAQAIFLYNP